MENPCYIHVDHGHQIWFLSLPARETLYMYFTYMSYTITTIVLQNTQKNIYLNIAVT